MAAKMNEPRKAARRAGLVYVDDSAPGIQRIPQGKSFVYKSPAGRRVRSRSTLARIQALVIPPAWNDVWICSNPKGHLQATGRDARGRKQYRYHAQWREVRDENKYLRLIDFARALPTIRRRIRSDLRQRSLSKEKVLATIVRLLEATLIRIGNEQYVTANQSFGLTTMRNRHVTVSGSHLEFVFQGKSGIRHTISLRNPQLASIVKQCQDLPGQHLFQYEDDEGQIRGIDSNDVNDYLRQITDQDFTAKDFRTWAGTRLTLRLLKGFESASSATAAKKNIAEAIRGVAQQLGNTAAVCRKCYIHPAVIDAYINGDLPDVPTAPQKTLIRLSPEERAVVKLLQGA